MAADQQRRHDSPGRRWSIGDNGRGGGKINRGVSEKEKEERERKERKKEKRERESRGRTGDPGWARWPAAVLVAGRR